MTIKKIITSLIAGAVVLTGCAQNNTATNMEKQEFPVDNAVVNMTKEISPEAIVKLYKALGREAKGKVAIKISTGEPGNHNFPRHGMHTLDYGEQIGLGTQTYKMITLD